MTRVQRCLYLIGFQIALLGVVAAGWLLTTPDHPSQFTGWAPEALPATEAWSSSLPKFVLRHPVTGEQIVQDNLHVRVILTDDVAQANGGRLPDNIPQQVGDCTSFGAAHAIEATQGAQCIRGPPQTFRRISTMWLYGASRVWVLNGQINGDGSTGSATAKAALIYGALPLDEAPPYSGQTARQWGQRGPPVALKEKALQHRVKTVALMRSAADVRDSICNRFGVTVASDWGNPKKQYRLQDGRQVAQRSGTWMHQMAVVGYDGTAPSGKRYYLIQQSWGPDSDPPSNDGTPPGTFWVEEHDMEYMVAPADSYAYSDFDGFPAQLDVGPLKPRPGPR